MLKNIKVVCPYCGEDDSTEVDMEERYLQWITTECASCDQTYAIKITLVVTTTVARIVLEKTEEQEDD
jgi:uncharacterized Zn finger protein